MKKILLVTNADMSRQSGDVVLVLRRAAALFALYGVTTDCVVVNRLLTGREIPHRTAGISFRTVADQSGLEQDLKSGSYGLVIVYGERTQSLIPYIKKTAAGPVRILIDLQGAVEEQIEYCGKGGGMPSTI